MIDELKVRPELDERELDGVGPDRLSPAEDTEAVGRSDFRPYLDDPE